MFRTVLAFWLIAAPLALSAQTAAMSKTRGLWIEFELTNPYASLATGQADQMTAAGYNYTQPIPTTCDPLDTTCVQGSGIYYPQQTSPSIGTGIQVGFNAGKWLTISAGEAYTRLGGAEGMRKDPIIGNIFVRSRWESQAYWLMPSWRPLPRLRIGAGPAYYSVRENESATQTSRFGLHAEAAVEVGMSGPIIASLAYKLDRAGTGSATNPQMTLNGNLNYSALVLGFGVRLFK